MKELFVDNFAGGGGASTGIEFAEELKQRLIERLIAGYISAQEQIITDYTEAISYIADFLVRKGVTIRERGEWIPVTERLPDMQDEVLTYSECNGVRAGSVIVEGKGNEETIWYLYRTGKISIAVTHWMPLPLPPEKENEDG